MSLAWQGTWLYMEQMRHSVKITFRTTPLRLKGVNKRAFQHETEGRMINVVPTSNKLTPGEGHEAVNRQETNTGKARARAAWRPGNENVIGLH